MSNGTYEITFNILVDAESTLDARSIGQKIQDYLLDVAEPFMDTVGRVNMEHEIETITEPSEDDQEYDSTHVTYLDGTIVLCDFCDQPILLEDKMMAYPYSGRAHERCNPEGPKPDVEEAKYHTFTDGSRAYCEECGEPLKVGDELNETFGLYHAACAQ